MLAHLIALPVAAYITRNHRRLIEGATALPSAQKQRLAPYFPEAILNAVRVHERDPLPIPHPPLTGLVRKLGFTYPDLSLTAAITFGDLIVTQAPMSISLLFHELVHVVQYRQLGIPAFARHYVQGLLTHRAYERIPLEAHAFHLEARFEFDRQPFNVEAEVTRLLNA